jgi:HAD superfamily hydrolase (TIGR01509 family)
MIFDFNGTLFQDADKHLRAWKTFALEKFGAELSDGEYFKNLEGRDDRFSVSYLARKKLSEREISDLSEAKEAMYRAACLSDRDGLRLTSGAEELFDFLAGRGIPLAIATASPKSNVDFYVETFRLDRWFDAKKIIYDDGGIPGKPAPDFYLRAAAAIGLPPGECAVAEDSLPGVCSAAGAGAGHITVIAPGARRAAFIGIAGVNSVIENFHEFDRGIFCVG